MIKHLRQPSSALRSTLLLMACAAMALQAAVPAGLMLDLDQATGELSFVLCPSQGAGTMPSTHSDVDPNGAHADHSQYDGAHPVYQTPGEACDFAVTAAASITPATATVAAFLAMAIEPVFEPPQAAPPSIARRPVSSRGPPHYS